MHTIIHTRNSDRSRSSLFGNVDDQKSFRSPHYECVEHAHDVEVLVFVPGVDATGVEITSPGPDLVVTARKSHFVRVNFQSLHLESAQRDYRLVLRLGNSLDFAGTLAEIRDGMLTVRIPKREARSSELTSLALSQVA